MLFVLVLALLVDAFPPPPKPAPTRHSNHIMYTADISVQDLTLDLHNFRTRAQPDELHAVQAFISIEPDEFWALMESLLEADGYLPTENILVLKADDTLDAQLIVREGNRRIAALKLIHGYLPAQAVGIPQNIAAKIAALQPEWYTANEHVPCAIYELAEAATVDRIVTLAHGKGEKAGRSRWKAVARARHNRDRGNAEPALDLLDKYLVEGKNITQEQKDRWAGVYPVTVLEEVMKRLAVRMGAANAPDLAKKYPNVGFRDKFDEILKAVGFEQVKFTTIRHGGDVGLKYGIPLATGASQGGSKGVAGAVSAGGSSVSGSTAAPSTGSATSGGSPATPSQGSGTGSGTTPPNAGATQGKKTAAIATNDPRAVRRLLKQFTPKGNGREKLVLLLNEARRLDIKTTPLAFCFVLRSMFDVSAHVYCDEHGIPTKNSKGYPRPLSELLSDVTAHLTNGGTNKAMMNEIHGALTNLQNKDGLLSVTSLNQLIHNKTFSISPSDISILFGNIFPLLAAMN